MYQRLNDYNSIKWRSIH